MSASGSSGYAAITDSSCQHKRANTLRLRTAFIAGVFRFAFMYGLFEQLMNMQLFEGLFPQYLW
jgi:hypothetical protein